MMWNFVGAFYEEQEIDFDIPASMKTPYLNKNGEFRLAIFDLPEEVEGKIALLEYSYISNEWIPIGVCEIDNRGRAYFRADIDPALAEVEVDFDKMRVRVIEESEIPSLIPAQDALQECLDWIKRERIYW